jgi:glycerophosphoryl diester phosphodiesterase
VTPPVVCAHGGTSDAHPNTLEAIRGVAAAGLQCVEIDVSRTADDVLVACHGRDLATLMGATAANVGDFTSDDVFALQSDRGHRVPTFQAAVQVSLTLVFGSPLFTAGA